MSTDSPFPRRRDLQQKASPTPTPPPPPTPPSRPPFPTPPAPTPKPTKQRRKVGFWAGLVGVIGEILITIAIILALYVVWQLWWTTYQVTPGMESRVVEFQESNPGTLTAGTERTDDPPIITEPGDQEIFGVLHVPKWDWMQIPIAQGTSQAVLDVGNAGHYEETQLPGEIGNFAVAGHRRTYGNNFRRVDILEPGDPIVVETENAYLVYEVTGHEIVDPSQVSVIYPVPNEPLDTEATKRLMTMTTCHPEYGNTERYIVYSEFKYWTAKDDGKPSILLDEPAR